MSKRMVSPRYPATPLDQAIEMTRKIHARERTNPIEREVAVQAMGYSGISGRSAKVLADLIQYGLLEKGSKNGIRVSARAVEILHPESIASRNEALRAAALEPALFRRISDRFPDGRPSDASLRSYFVREGFTDAAIPAAVRAYLETCEFLERETESADGHRATTEQEHTEALPGGATEAAQPEFQQPKGRPVGTKKLEMIYDFGNRRAWVSGHLTSKAEAKELIDFAKTVEAMLPDDGLGPFDDDDQ